MFYYDSALIEILVFVLLFLFSWNMMARSFFASILAMLVHTPDGLATVEFFTAWLAWCFVFAMGFKFWAAMGLGYVVGSGDLKDWIKNK